MELIVNVKICHILYGHDRSSSIQSINFRQDNKLTITFFKNKSKYTYDNVPKQIALDFIKAPSKGRYFHKYIKGQYKVIEKS